MTDMEKEGLVGKDDVHQVVLKISDMLQGKCPNLLELYAKGLKVLLTSDGLYLTDRKEIGELQKCQGIFSIIDVLTIDELYKYMEEHSQYFKHGKNYAVLQIMEYRLREKMDDVYEDNTELIYKNIESKQKMGLMYQGGEGLNDSRNKRENAVW